MPYWLGNKPSKENVPFNDVLTVLKKVFGGGLWRTSVELKEGCGELMLFLKREPHGRI
jgi:hypothetical protein